MLHEGNKIHNFISISGSGCDFLTSYGSVSGSTSQKVTVPTVPVPQRWILETAGFLLGNAGRQFLPWLEATNKNINLWRQHGWSICETHLVRPVSESSINASGPFHKTRSATLIMQIDFPNHYTNLRVSFYVYNSYERFLEVIGKVRYPYLSSESGMSWKVITVEEEGGGGEGGPRTRSSATGKRRFTSACMVTELTQQHIVTRLWPSSLYLGSWQPAHAALKRQPYINLLIQVTVKNKNTRIGIKTMPIHNTAELFCQTLRRARPEHNRNGD